MKVFLEYVLGPLLGGLAVVYAGWSARRSEEKQKHEDAAQQSHEHVVESYDRLNADLQTRIDALNALVAGLDERLQEHRDRIVALESEADRQRNVIRAFVSYVDALLTLVQAHKIEPPARPPQLAPFWES